MFSLRKKCCQSSIVATAITAVRTIFFAISGTFWFGMTVMIILFQLIMALPTIQALFSAITTIGDTIDSRTLLRREQSAFTQAYTTGQMKQNIYDWLNGVWTGSVYVPIGTCIDSETVTSKKNSYRLSKILDARDGKLILVTDTFPSQNCTGSSAKLAVSVLDSTSQNQLDLTTSVMSQWRGDQRQPSFVVIKTYLTSNGCTSTPAQVEVLPMSCAVRLGPLNSYGIFTCNNKDNVVTYTRYGAFNNTAYTYPDCTKYPDIQLETDEYPVTTEIQPFKCTRVDTADKDKDGEETMMMYQTIECSPSK